MDALITTGIMLSSNLVRVEQSSCIDLKADGGMGIVSVSSGSGWFTEPFLLHGDGRSIGSTVRLAGRSSRYHAPSRTFDASPDSGIVVLLADDKACRWQIDDTCEDFGGIFRIRIKRSFQFSVWSVAQGGVSAAADQPTLPGYLSQSVKLSVSIWRLR